MGEISAIAALVLSVTHWASSLRFHLQNEPTAEKRVVTSELGDACIHLALIFQGQAALYPLQEAREDRPRKDEPKEPTLQILG